VGWGSLVWFAIGRQFAIELSCFSQIMCGSLPEQAKRIKDERAYHASI